MAEAAIKTEFKFVCAWNTGRSYTEKGQRIAVWDVLINDELRAYFMVDLDRGLYYFFEPLSESPWHRHPREIRAWVQECYDHNRHELFPYQFALGSDDLFPIRDEVIRIARTMDPSEFEPWTPLYL